MPEGPLTEDIRTVFDGPLVSQQVDLPSSVEFSTFLVLSGDEVGVGGYFDNSKNSKYPYKPKFLLDFVF